MLGMASITVSMPLLGESRPKVRMTVLPLNPNLAFAWLVSRKGKSGMPCAITSILCGDTACTDRRSSRPFSAITMIFVD